MPQTRPLGGQSEAAETASTGQNRAVEQAGTSGRQWAEKSPSDLNSSDWRSLGRCFESLTEPGDEASSFPTAQEALPQQPPAPEQNIDSVKDVIKARLLVHRLGQRHATVSDEEINRIVDLKRQIIDRMAQLDVNPFWTQQGNTLIQDYLRPPRGGEFKTSVLEAKLQDLFGQNAPSSKIYKELLRARDFFHIDGPFRGPRG